MGKLTFSDLEVYPLGRDAAYVLGRWHLDRVAGPIGGNFTLVLRREDGWRIVHDHTSVWVPPDDAGD
jgi:ketosteroid isomerase-like protein